MSLCSVEDVAEDEDAILLMDKPFKCCCCEDEEIVDGIVCCCNKLLLLLVVLRNHGTDNPDEKLFIFVSLFVGYYY